MNTPKVFVVCPIGSAASLKRQYSDRLLGNVVVPVMDQLQCDVIRGDQIPNPGRINDQIDHVLRSADIVIADLRDLNPNVMYELGVRQGLGLPWILMAPQGQRLPFDLHDYRTIFYPRDLEAVDEVKRQLKMQVQKALRDGPAESEYSWLHKNNMVARIEENADCNSIWVITPDLYQSTNCPFFKEVVQKNLERGITYTYIFPKTDQTISMLDTLRQIFSSYPNQLVERPMPDDIFRTMSVSHYLVFELEASGDLPPQVFLELPIESREYWIEVDRDAARGFFSRFYRIAKGL